MMQSRLDPWLEVVLHQPEIPQNTGNVGRTCLAVGARLWLVRPLGFEITEKRLRRAGLDYWQHLDCRVVDDWPAIEAALPGRRFWLLSRRAPRRHTDADYRPGDVLVFGGETRGLPGELLERYAGQTLRIPMRPQVRSLNLSSSAAVVMYEALRQQGREWAEEPGPQP